MQAPIREALAERLLEIPETLRDALLGQAFSISIAEISDRYKLSEYQELMLEKETAFLIAGVTRPEEYLGRLMEELEVSQTTSKHLAAEINLWVFNPIKEDLFAFHEELAAAIAQVEQEEKVVEAKKEPENPNLPEPISDFLKTIESDVPQKRTMAQDVAMRQMRQGAAEKAETVAVAKRIPENVPQKPVVIQAGNVDPYQESIE